MPCHPAHGQAVLTKFDYYGPRQCWEQGCIICGQLYRYQSRAGIGRHRGERLVQWEPIDRFTDPLHPPREPLDCFLVEWRKAVEDVA